MDVADRLLERSVRDGGCLRWTGAHNAKGYGQISVNGRLRAVHRVAYERWVGPIPGGHEIDHVHSRGCRHRDCIEPTHLEPVTHRENLARAARAGVPWPIETHCRRGHPWGPDNLVSRTDGARDCQTCSKERRSRPTPCDVCGTRVMYKNMARHKKRFHERTD